MKVKLFNKKVFSIILSVIMLISVIPVGTVTASAAIIGYYTYSVSNGKATITDCITSTSGDITIPSELNGYPVTSIGVRAFEGCYNLTSVTIPESVTSIGELAFKECSRLTSVTIPNSVTSIGEQAFRSCEALTSVTIPDSVTSIGESAFEVCYALTSVAIGNGVTNIGERAFYGCKSLTSVNILSLEDWCNITFGHSYANPLNYAHNLYLNGNLVTDLVIPDSVTSIGDWAFYGCKSLTSVTIPNTIRSIGLCAFDLCNNITDVYYDGITSDWNKISFGVDNDNLLNAKISYVHTYNSVRIITQATCTNFGIMEYTCSGCGRTYTENIPALGHKWGDWTSNGDYATHKRTCSVCNTTETENCTYSVTDSKDATCTEDGYKTYSCSVCGDTYTEEFKSSGHTWGPWISTGDQKTHTKECSVCGLIETGDCTYEIISNKAPTCISDGYKVWTCSVCHDIYTEDIPALGHTWSDWASNGDHETHTRNCTVCGETETVGCTYTVTDSKDATCTEDGYKTYTCSVCGDTYTEDIPASGHMWGAWISAGDQKSHTKECSVCGLIETGDCTYEIISNKAPTCISDGYKVWNCSVCHDIYTEDIPAFGHTWSDWNSNGDYETHKRTCSVCNTTETENCTYTVTDSKDASCTEDGYKTYTCSICGDTYTEEISAMGHSWSEWASCEGKGVHSRTCSVCDMIETQDCEYAVVVNNAPSCTEYGYKVWTCPVCHDIYTEDIPALGHTWSDWTSNGDHETHTRNCTACEDSQTEACAYEITDSKPATINVNGYITYTCSDCDDQKSSTIYYPKTIKLSTTSYTYDGKVKKPAVTVKDSAGKTISSANYTVTYASGRQYVGKYAVKVTFKGSYYSGSKILYFNINPRNTSISKLTSGRKSFKVYLKKYTTQTTGYQIQYSTSSKFTGAKTVTVSNKTTAKTISKLYGGKRYYVRCRTYKKVGKTNFFSSWSGAKAVTTRK